uniref:NADH-ubiquinone oxidoreductase chain 1 n=1 Tax=Enterobius vermicularis TaxID=51028 RepID=A0A1E1GIK3_ENTVE|nr:NADH dehydrogenase subunit 1 [Enterobius vermicularis]BAV82703.1 NADH dehydrogenase subunit 1 [Enterobius vermicularis]
MFFLVLVLMLLLVQGVAFITLCERHLLGGSQQRVGPNKVSFMGVLQAIFDGVKLIKKEQLLSVHSSGFSFVFIPGITFLVMYMEWFVMFYLYDFFSFGYSVLMFMCLMGFSVYSFLLSGIVSKSKYGLLGALRASNQSVSYEIAFSLFLLSVIVFMGGYCFVPVGLGWFFFLGGCVFFVILGELNRAPFDFSEGESELVSGYNVEYGSVSYALLYIGEYGSMLFFSLLISLMFFNYSFFIFYLVFVVLIFVRSSYPRFRYDMMMGFFWFIMLPLSLFLVFFFVVLLV